MHKLIIVFLGFILPTLNAGAQFYYKDILSAQQLVSTMASYKENKIKVVNIKSFEDDGSESEGFFCQKKVSRDYRKTELFTRSNISSSSLMTAIFDKDGKVMATNDSSSISVSDIRYAYDATGRVLSIVSMIKSQDDDFTNAITEEHIYVYDEQNHPIKMTRIKNLKDTSFSTFALDEKNNVAIEKDSKTGTKYYYYYDGKNRLTDIVQTNDFRNNLHPDYIFEYNNSNQVTQMTVTEEGGNDYFVWKYSYNNGLRVAERCYTKERKLMGSVEYEYN